MNQSPVNAFQNSFLNYLSVAFDGAHEVLEMRLNEEDLAFLELALSEKLEHLNQALAGFLHQTDVEVEPKHFNADFKVAKDLLDVINNLFFITLNNLVELCQQIMKNIEHYFQTPFLSVLQHTCH